MTQTKESAPGMLEHIFRSLTRGLDRSPSMAESHSSSTRPHLDDFTEGVRWGIFLMQLWEDEDPRADMRRTRLLAHIADQIDKTPDAPMKALRPEIADEWDRQAGICHLHLEPGEICGECGQYSADA